MGKSKRKWRSVTTLKSFKEREEIRVVGISRVSTDRQAEQGDSLDAQKEAIENWVKLKSSVHTRQEWRLIDILIEGEEEGGRRRGRSGTSREGRECLNKAMMLAKAGEIDCIVCTKLDRVARNTQDYIEIQNELNEYNVALVVFDLDIDTSSPDGQMIMRFFASLAQWQADRISQYAYETTLRHLDQGRPIGKAPMGYKNSGKSYIVDEKFVDHVKLIEQLYLEHESINKVVEIMNEQGYRTERKKLYTKTLVSYTLRNIRYLGQQEYEGRIYQGNWPVLRDQATHDLIQKILKRNTRAHHSRKQTPSAYTFYLQGLLKCPLCKSSMISHTATGRSKSYAYYLCSKADKTSGTGCKKNFIPAKGVDDALLEYLKQLRFDPELIGQIVEKTNKMANKELQTIKTEKAQVNEELATVRKKITNLTEVLADQGIQGSKALLKQLSVQEVIEEDLEKSLLKLKENEKEHELNTASFDRQIETLALFDQVSEMFKDEPMKIKNIIPNFVNYIIYEEKEDGNISFSVNLFNRPFIKKGDEHFWKDTLQQLNKGFGNVAECSVNQKGNGSPERKKWLREQDSNL